MHTQITWLVVFLTVFVHHSSCNGLYKLNNKTKSPFNSLEASTPSPDITAESLYNQFLRLKDENATDTSEAITLAYLVKQVLEIPGAHRNWPLHRNWRAKMDIIHQSLPDRIKTIIWKETVIIESVPHVGYYLFGGKSHVYYTSWRYRNSFQWTLEPVDEARRFRIKDGKTNRYMYAVGDEESYSWRRPIAMGRDHDGLSGEWRFEPYGEEGFTLQNARYDEYLYASNFLGRYKGSLWDVYTWRDMRDGKFPQCIWKFV